MFKDENKASSLAEFLSKFDYAFVDTCSLMEDSFPEWMDILVNAKKDDYLPESLHIIVVRQCVLELKEHAKNKENNTKRIIAKRALKILRLVKRKKVIEFPRKSLTVSLADNVIYATVSNLRLTKKCLIITQDKGLAYDLRQMNYLSSQKGKWLDVYKLVPGGTLEVNKGEPVQRIQRDYHQKNEKKSFFKNKSIKKQKEAPKQEAKPKEVALSDQQKAVVDADLALNAKLNNPNYSKEKKIQDIRAQQKLIAACPDYKSLKLINPLEKLVHEVAVLEKEVFKTEPKKEPAPAKKEIEPKKEEKKVEPKPTEKKAEKPDPSPAQAKKLWYEYGPSIESAIARVAEHHGIMVRDSSIAYVPQIHGERDFTNSDLQKVAENLSKGKPSYIFKQMKFMAEKSEKGYKAMIDFDVETPVKPEAKPEPKPAEKPAKEKAKPTTKKAEPKKEEKKEEPKKEPKPKKAAKKSEPQKVEEPEQVKATLLVAVPDETKKAAKTEKKAKPLAPKAEPKKEAKKPAAKKEEKAPAKEKAEKKAPTKKEEKKPEVKQEAKKPVEKPAKAKETKKATEPKKEDKKPAKTQDKSPLEEALAAEKVFSANINNPNFPIEKKKASLQKQIELVSKVDPSDRNKLSFTIDSMKAMLAILK